MTVRFFLCFACALLLVTACRGESRPPVTERSPGSGEDPAPGAREGLRAASAAAAASAGARTAPARTGPTGRGASRIADDHDQQSPALAPTPTPAKKEPVPLERSPVEVRVRRGESMGRYGAWAHISMPDLYERVGLRWNERLRVGRVLRIPMGVRERARFRAERKRFHQRRRARYDSVTKRPYRVRRGDNAWRIARRRGVPLWLLEDLNGGRDLRDLQVGQVIQVPAPRHGDGDS